MNKALVIVLFMIAGFAAHAQFVLGRQSISCFSVRACDELCINSTAGQIDFGSMNNASTIFTPGFEQTEGAANLYPSIQFRKDECSGLIKAEILQTFGCEGADSVFVFWDNAPGNLVSELSGSLHILRLESSTGCSFEKTYDFQVIDVPVIPCGLEFFNYVSPNGDGSNDTWVIGKIEADDYSQNEVVILNRWGGVVWSAVNYNNEDVCWKGNGLQGQALPDGTYFYRLKTRQGEYTGYIELMR